MAVDVSMQLTVATTADEATSLYVFLGGLAITELNYQLNKTGEIGWSCIDFLAMIKPHNKIQLHGFGSSWHVVRHALL